MRSIIILVIIIIINEKFLPFPTTILHPSSICLFAVLRPPRGKKGVARGVEAIRKGTGGRDEKKSRCRGNLPAPLLRVKPEFRGLQGTPDFQVKVLGTTSPPTPSPTHKMLHPPSIRSWKGRKKWRGLPFGSLGTEAVICKAVLTC